MSLELHLNGTGSLRAWLRQTMHRLSRRTALHERAGQAVLGWVRRAFATEGRANPASPGWPALSPGTLEHRRRRGRGTRILQASGRLRQGTRLRSGVYGASVENPVPYAAAHQFGRGVPARPFLPTPPQTRRIVDPVVEAFVRDATGGQLGASR